MYRQQVPLSRRIFAKTFQVTRLSRALIALQALVYYPFVRVVNYHSTPACYARQLERHLRFYQRNFAPVTYDDLLALQRGRWTKPMPGLIICFDDGMRNNFEIARPLLEKYGFVGWFLVPAGFVDTDIGDQLNFARVNHLAAHGNEYPDGRIAMSWAEIQHLDRSHVVGCHTFNHRRLSAALTDTELDHEIRAAKEKLEAHLSHSVPVFCWVGGEEWAYSARAAQYICQAGFEVSLMTNNAIFRAGDNLLQVQRTNIEAAWDDDIVHFQLSGFLDLVYWQKRHRVNKLTRGTTELSR